MLQILKAGGKRSAARGGLNLIMMNYTLIRSKRKTIAIYITKEATVEVRAPINAAKPDIDRFVASRRNWIERNLTELKRRAESRAAFKLNYGENIAFRGKPYQITAKAGNRAGFDGKSFFLPSGLTQDGIKHTIIQVYKLLAKRLLTDKAIYYAKLMGLTPSAVKINGAKTHWGSCSGKNSVNFSWRLVMADDEAIDYVVVHELAHIKELNHSERFWTVVASVLPDYPERQAKLKKLQRRLANEDWE